jgi:hypothetical protein
MPPLQERGQLRWNTEYALDNEPYFAGAHKRWILNRIWNETEFTLLYGALISSGVNRRDIITRCFDVAEYSRYKDMNDKLFYLTSQNEGRNVGIMDGRNSGFEWSVILDGNTYITGDSWTRMQRALQKASAENKQYLKIPYHRVHTVQDEGWLNSSTTMKTVVQYAPMKGESQVAFRKSATELFTLGDTNPSKKDAGQRKGYGQRNKSYMFKEGQICGENSSICACANVDEGNEQDMADGLEVKTSQYTHDCGLVLRLWNYPTANVIHTGLSEKDEEGFFCFYKKNGEMIDASFKHSGYSECARMRKGVTFWANMTTTERKPYRADAASCKAEYHLIYLSESCFRAEDRALAQDLTSSAIEDLAKAYKKKPQKTLCQRLRPGPDDPVRKPFLISFFDHTLNEEKDFYHGKDKTKQAMVKPYVDRIIADGKFSLKQGPFYVTDKKSNPSSTTDRRFYYSIQPEYWDENEIPMTVKKQIGTKEVEKQKTSSHYKGKIYIPNTPAPGATIGDAKEDLYDRSRMWYLITNVTTLALSWHFTGEQQYADHGAHLVREFFLDPKKGMYPSFQFAQEGDHRGILEFKDAMYFVDALTMLERSGSLTPTDVKGMRYWCAKMSRWMMVSKQGHEMGRAAGTHGLYFDLVVLSLAVYAKNDDLVDVTRSRMKYRLHTLAPSGHFGMDGSQPHEVVASDSLHAATFNLLGWIHAATIVEAVRLNEELPGAMESLFYMRHHGTRGDDPVLLKAIRWLMQYLPESDSFYKKPTKPSTGMGVRWPYVQKEAFAFDRMLEVMHYGVQFYGLERVFPDTAKANVKVALAWDQYSTKSATIDDWTSVDIDSGARLWPSLGVIYRQSAGYKRYDGRQ